MYAKAKPAGRLMLVAAELAIDHPRSGKRMKFELPAPPQMQGG
jgi:23S rRNA-/tRNA-specific pseudouridylate synthase